VSPVPLHLGESDGSTAERHAPASAEDSATVAAQIGRVPRAPWRVATRCRLGYPTVVVSPSRLADGTPFPTFAWLTCPWLAELACAAESRGETAEWASRASTDTALRSRLVDADRAVREMRAAESDDEDACASVGIAGQRSPLGVKCLHAHLALALVGIDDPIGADLLARGDVTCPDARCARLTQDVAPSEGRAHAKEDA
jgi:hypothetical protein